MNEKDELLNGILQSADRHPNSRVSKLIRLVESERTQKNIVMLLIELAENSEYATDFGISLKYYLDWFERLGIGRDIMLNETGLLLLNSSKIYSRRVDYVHELIERQILTLSNADREIADAKNSAETANAAAAAPEKPKRGRKRLLEAPKDPYEIVLAPKKFRKIGEDKRFAINTTNAATIKANQVKLKAQLRHLEAEQHIHPAGWVHSTIVDLENDEELDSKRNYKLFTYHVEHRYNTLVPDINFRLHFMVKDYIDEEEEQLGEQSRENGENHEECTMAWPPLSEAYVEKYLELENRLLESGEQPRKKRAKTGSKQTQETPSLENVTDADGTSGTTEAAATNAQTLSDANESHFEDAIEVDTTTIVTHSDSGLGESISGTNDSSIVTEEGKDKEKDASSSCERQNEEPKAPKENEKASEESEVSDASKKGNEADISTLESTHNNDDIDNTSNSILDASTNITNDALNSTSIANSTAMSTSEATNSTSMDLSASDNSANDSTLNESNSTTQVTDATTDTSCTSETMQQDSALGASLELSSNSLPLSQDKGDEGNNDTAQEKTPNEATVLSKAEEKSNKSPTKKATKSDDKSNANEAKVDETEKAINLPATKSSSKDDTQINLDEIRIRLPHLDDEGVFFSDLDEQEQRMLSPTVMALDVLPCVPNKRNITIIVDDEIRAMLNIPADEPETYVMAQEKCPKGPPEIKLNIMKLPEKKLRHRLLFKLGTEFDLYLQARVQKRKRGEDQPPREYRPLKQMKWFHMNDTDMSGVHVSPVHSPGHSSADFRGFSDDDFDDDDFSDFLGFPDDEIITADLDDKNSHRLSRDSGVDGVEGPTVNDKVALSSISEELKEESQPNTDDLNKSKENFSAASNSCPAKSADVENTANVESNSTIEEANSQKEDQGQNIPGKTANVESNCTAEAANSQKEDQGQNNEAQATTTAVNEAEQPSEDNQTTTANEVERSSEDNQSGGKNGELAEKSTGAVVINNVQNLVENNGTDEAATEVSDAEENVNNEANATNVDHALDEIDLNSSKTKIQQWHEHLQPILAKSRERHHFDVFEIGTEIMNELTQSMDESSDEEADQPSYITFQDVMESKDESYVSRYFLSSLLLANQSNISISVANKSTEEPTAWEDIQFELLSTKRHTVSIEDNIGMVQKGASASEVAKTKSSKSHLKRPATDANIRNSGNKNVSALPTSSSSCVRQSAQQETHTRQMINVNLSVVKPLKHIEKVPRNGDDYDSGIFSSEELM